MTQGVSDMNGGGKLGNISSSVDLLLNQLQRCDTYAQELVGMTGSGLQVKVVAGTTQSYNAWLPSSLYTPSDVKPEQKLLADRLATCCNMANQFVEREALPEECMIRTDLKVGQITREKAENLLTSLTLTPRYAYEKLYDVFVTKVDQYADAVTMESNPDPQAFKNRCLEAFNQSMGQLNQKAAVQVLPRVFAKVMTYHGHRPFITEACKELADRFNVVLPKPEEPKGQRVDVNSSLPKSKKTNKVEPPPVKQEKPNRSRSDSSERNSLRNSLKKSGKTKQKKTKPAQTVKQDNKPERPPLDLPKTAIPSTEAAFNGKVTVLKNPGRAANGIKKGQLSAQVNNLVGTLDWGERHKKLSLNGASELLQSFTNWILNAPSINFEGCNIDAVIRVLKQCKQAFPRLDVQMLEEVIRGKFQSDQEAKARKKTKKEPVAEHKAQAVPQSMERPRPYSPNQSLRGYGVDDQQPMSLAESINTFSKPEEVDVMASLPSANWQPEQSLKPYVPMNFPPVQPFGNKPLEEAVDDALDDLPEPSQEALEQMGMRKVEDGGQVRYEKVETNPYQYDHYGWDPSKDPNAQGVWVDVDTEVPVKPSGATPFVQGDWDNVEEPTTLRQMDSFSVDDLPPPIFATPEAMIAAMQADKKKLEDLHRTIARKEQSVRQHEQSLRPAMDLQDDVSALQSLRFTVVNQNNEQVDLEWDEYVKVNQDLRDRGRDSLPYDPNLVDPKGGRRFHIGQIIEFRLFIEIRDEVARRLGREYVSLENMPMFREGETKAQWVERVKNFNSDPERQRDGKSISERLMPTLLEVMADDKIVRNTRYGENPILDGIDQDIQYFAQHARDMTQPEHSKDYYKDADGYMIQERPLEPLLYEDFKVQKGLNDPAQTFTVSPGDIIWADGKDRGLPFDPFLTMQGSFDRNYDYHCFFPIGKIQCAREFRELMSPYDYVKPENNIQKTYTHEHEIIKEKRIDPQTGGMYIHEARYDLVFGRLVSEESYDPLVRAVCVADEGASAVMVLRRKNPPMPQPRTPWDKG